jgi:hypothetical protein
VALLADLSSAGAAPRGGEESGETATKKREAAATLEILEDGVSVRRKAQDEFKDAKDDQKLFVGDTVKTDDTGFAQINYTDAGDTFTRLDVNTEFTLVSITDDEGNRKVNGSVDVGRSWNRTTALSESETFEQEGAGATAAVIGSLFVVDCRVEADEAGAQHVICTFISLVDGLRVTTIDGEIQDLEPLQQCDSTEIVTDEDADLCDAPSAVDLQALLQDPWFAKNFYLDALLGLPLPQLSGIIVFEAGEVQSFTPTSSGGGTTAPSVIDPTNPIGCEFGCDQTGVVDGAELPEDFDPGNEIVTSFFDVEFVANLLVDPAGLVIVFDTLPDIGTIYWLCGVECSDPVVIGDSYDADSHFEYDPDESGATDFTFHIEHGTTGENLGSATVPVTVEESGELSSEGGESTGAGDPRPGRDGERTE